MTLLKSVIATIYFLIMFLTATNSRPVNHVIKGVVVHKETGEPIAAVYLYTIKGEEEAVTNKNGEFQLISWQKLPLTLHVQDKEEKQTRIVVSNTAQSISIKL